MATISSLGIGSGLDVNSIITQLMAIEKQPLNKLKTDESKIQTQISEVGKIKNAVSTFRDAATKLASADFWKQTTGSSDSTAVAITTGSGAVAGNHVVEVTQLASAQSLASTGFAASTTVLGAGTLRIELGSWGANNASFTPKTGATALDITVEATDTLASLRDKINTAGGGVTASILNDGTGARLVMRSSETGAANGFRTSVTGDAALGAFAYDPSSGVSTATRSTSAADAKATINGLAVTSTTNTLADVMDGVTLTLNATTTTPANLAVKPDAAAIKDTLTKFATAWSDLSKLITTDTKYDAANKKAGPLQGDSAVIGLQNRMRAILGSPSGATTAFTRLSDAGFELQRDGTLTVNATKLDKAIANLPELKKLFSNIDATNAGNEGFARRFRAAANEVIGIDGALSTRSDGLNTQLERNRDRQDLLQQRLDQTQKRLEKQYSQLDAKLGQLNGLGSYVSQQVTTWNKG